MSSRRKIGRKTGDKCPTRRRNAEFSTSFFGGFQGIKTPESSTPSGETENETAIQRVDILYHVQRRCFQAGLFPPGTSKSSPLYLHGKKAFAPRQCAGYVQFLQKKEPGPSARLKSVRGMFLHWRLRHHQHMKTLSPPERPELATFCQEEAATSESVLRGQVQFCTSAKSCGRWRLLIQRPAAMLGNYLSRVQGHYALLSSRCSGFCWQGWMSL